MWQFGITQSQHCNNDVDVDDDKVMRVSVWFEGKYLCENISYLGGKRDNKEWDLNQKHFLLWVLGYKRRVTSRRLILQSLKRKSWHMCLVVRIQELVVCFSRTLEPSIDWRNIWRCWKTNARLRPTQLSIISLNVCHSCKLLYSSNYTRGIIYP